MIGLQALSIALAEGALPPAPVLFRLPGLPAVLRQLYAAADFAHIRDLPWNAAEPGQPFAAATAFGISYDLRDFAFDPAFRGVAMIDFFLSRLGVEAGSIEAGRRRNTWLAPRVRPLPPPFDPGYALVCPNASMDLRAMPDAVHAELLRRLADHPVVTQRRPVGPERAVVAPAAHTLAELCGLVAFASVVVTTDTAMAHLADAFSVPCLAIFTTHRPEWRVRDYVFCRAIHRPPAGLPPALEFSRGEADLRAAHTAWFDADGGLRWLDAALNDLPIGGSTVRPGAA